MLTHSAPEVQTLSHGVLLPLPAARALAHLLGQHPALLQDPCWGPRLGMYSAGLSEINGLGSESMGT